MTDAELADAVEQSQLLVLPELPAVCAWFDDDGVRGREAAIDNPTANGVLVTRLHPDRVDDAVARIQRRFVGTRYGWVVSSLSAPSDLDRRLIGRGFHLRVEASGMVLRDLRPTAPPTGVRVRLATPDDLGLAAETNAAAYGMPLEVSSPIVRCHLASPNSRIYLAYPKGSDAPAGLAILVRVPGTRLVVMASAATVPACRGQGVYSALVHRRLDDACAFGADTAIVHAITATSAPICHRRGYREVIRLGMYVA